MFNNNNDDKPSDHKALRVKAGDLYIGIKITKEEKKILNRISIANFRTLSGQLRFMIQNWELLVEKAKMKGEL